MVVVVTEQKNGGTSNELGWVVGGGEQDMKLRRGLFWSSGFSLRTWFASSFATHVFALSTFRNRWFGVFGGTTAGPLRGRLTLLFSFGLFWEKRDINKGSRHAAC